MEKPFGMEVFVRDIRDYVTGLSIFGSGIHSFLEVEKVPEQAVPGAEKLVVESSVEGFDVSLNKATSLLTA